MVISVLLGRDKLFHVRNLLTKALMYYIHTFCLSFIEMEKAKKITSKLLLCFLQKCQPENVNVMKNKIKVFKFEFNIMFIS